MSYTLYVANAFALGMLPDGLTISVCTLPSAEAARDVLHGHMGGRYAVRSIVGHADTATVFAQQLGFPVEHNRESVTLDPHDKVLVGQLTGGRLPEGTTELPEGFQIVWRLVQVREG